MPPYSLDQVRGVRRRRESWLIVLLVDPVAVRLTRLLANRTRIGPDRVTTAAFGFGLAAAGAFLLAARELLAAGAAAYAVSLLLERTDGKLARLTGRVTESGAWLDQTLGRLRDLCCALALTIGQYAAAHRVGYLFLALLILVLDMFRHVNDQQLRGVRTRFRRPARPSNQPWDDERTWPERRYAALRGALGVRRIHLRLFGGTEFQVAVFVLGPALHLVIPVTAAAVILLVLFDVAAIYRLWVWTRDGVPVSSVTVVEDRSEPLVCGAAGGR